jgi:hypothetical protein
MTTTKWWKFWQKRVTTEEIVPDEDVITHLGELDVLVADLRRDVDRALRKVYRDVKRGEEQGQLTPDDEGLSDLLHRLGR